VSVAEFGGIRVSWETLGVSRSWVTSPAVGHATVWSRL